MYKRMNLFELPDDILYYIYKTYYTLYVLPTLPKPVTIRCIDCDLNGIMCYCCAVESGLEINIEEYMDNGQF